MNQPSTESQHDHDGGIQKESPSSWVDEHADALYRFALRRISDPHVIEDLLQETFLAAIESRSSFRGDSSVRTWLIAILKLKIIDYYRRESRSRIDADSQLEKHTGCSCEGPRSAWDYDSASSVENEEFWSVFFNCVDQLPSSLANCYVLQEVDQRSAAEVCELLGLTRNHLAVKIYRARAALRSCLEKLWFSAEK